MAFLDESDTRQPQAVRRSRLVPALLILLNAGVLALVLVISLGKPDVAWLKGTAQPAEVDVSLLDPAMLTTPSGRRMDVQQFGGYVFEVTRLTYSRDPDLRSVTITVPGSPPRQAVFRVGDSFADGQLRVLQIERSSVVLANGQEQRTFTVDGGDPNEVWNRPSIGTQIIPARNRGAIPDLPAGQTRPPRDPRLDVLEEQAAEPESPAVLEALELDDFPLEYRVPMPRSEFQLLTRTLHEILEDEFVFGTAINPQSRQADGARILNLRSSSLFYARGMRAGDDIVAINDTDVRKPSELLEAARAMGSAESLRFVVWREAKDKVLDFESGYIIFTFYSGASE